MQEIIPENVLIENMIYEIRGKQVMLDSDLAKLYDVETKRINEAVKRNKDRFPNQFHFQLTDKEALSLRSQNATSKGGRRYNPYAFTEQGVAMLATVLNSKIAIQTSIKIISAFVSMRKYFSQSLLEQKYINNQVMKNTEDIRLLQESFQKFEERKVVNEIYFNGQIYDAYSKILDIVQEAKIKLIIIDGYADKIILDIVRNAKVPVTVITKSQNSIFKNDVIKYNKQYHNLKVVYDDTFHDRYFIIDNQKIYHCGTSVNHAGSRTFSINVLEDEMVKRLTFGKCVSKNLA